MHKDFLRTTHSVKPRISGQINITQTRISEDMDLTNKAITDRGYEHTHTFGQWMHVEGEMGRGILIVCK